MVFPSEWEYRETTGRDYGIDMVIELFCEGVGTGTSLNLQIKGTRSAIESIDGFVSFDIPVSTLKYSEEFLTPMVLVFCSTTTQPVLAYYIWLQEYINIVLDPENPNWRSNKASVRLKIPADNAMPGRKSHLAFIANHPKRISDWCRIGQVLYQLRKSFWSTHVDDWTVADLKNAKEALENALSLNALFSDRNWSWGQLQRRFTIEPALKAAQLLIRGGPFTIGEVESTNLSLSCDAVEAVGNGDERLLEIMLRSTLAAAEDKLFAALATSNDYELKRTHWKSAGEHDF